ncbi:MAG: AAA domain-containing protein [Actinomycetia bacterium]|nr:AAA domain-containing protein [Actinomycetes bacterium]
MIGTGPSSTNATSSALGVAVAAGIPVLLWGAPGTGKSSAVRAMADAIGWPCEVVIASIREPTDFAGLPVVVDDGIRFAPPTWATRLAASERGVLFLDEISTAPPAVQAALLRVVLERVVGDLSLPDSIAVVAAANPPDQAADGWDLSAPLANRFCHLDWDVEPSAVAEGLAGGFPDPVVPALPANWESRLPTTRAQVAAFLVVRPGLVSAPPTERAAAGRAWPSPRSWEMAARLLGAALVAEVPGPIRSALVTGCVGQGAGIEFLSWLDELDLPDPEAVLADPGSFDLPERGDRAYAVLTSVAAAVAANATRERWAAGWVVLGRAGETAPDVAAVAARILARCRPEGAVAPPQAAAFLPLLQQAGLL